MENPGYRSAASPEACQPSCAAPPPPSTHTKQVSNKHHGYTDEGKRSTYVFLGKEVLHLLLPGLAEGIGLQGGEPVIDGQVHLDHSGYTKKPETVNQDPKNQNLEVQVGSS